MRAERFPLLVGVPTSRRRKRAGRRCRSWVVTLAVLPATSTTLLQTWPSRLARTAKLRGFQAGLSPPAPACLRTSLSSGTDSPRSTCSQYCGPCEHHFSLVLPPRAPACLIRKPVTGISAPRSTWSQGRFSSEHHLVSAVASDPSTARSGPVWGVQGREPVTHLWRATLMPGSAKDGGRSAAAVPQVRLGVAPVVKARVAPPAISPKRS